MDRWSDDCGWPASHGETVEYDLAVSSALRDLRDLLVRTAVGLLERQLRIGEPDTLASLRAIEEVLDQLPRRAAPPSRKHEDLHLARAVRRLHSITSRVEPTPAETLRGLELAWRDLSMAAGNRAATFLDLSQCCGGAHHIAEILRPGEGALYGAL